MSSGRKRLNIALTILTLILGGLVAWLSKLPPPVFSPAGDDSDTLASGSVVLPVSPAGHDGKASLHAGISAPENTSATKPDSGLRLEASKQGLIIGDFNTDAMIADHPFSIEAAKVLSGRLEETDSINRVRILCYCEQLRTSYNKRDIDFIRQVYSDDALIIVGHVVKATDGPETSGFNERVQYSIRSKQAYIERLAEIFRSGRKIDVRFSDFSIMRHPTSPDMYGVTLRQRYRCGSYHDDGYLFLLWDFSSPDEPQIHVRTWQPAATVAADGNDIIDISDFNLE